MARSSRSQTRRRSIRTKSSDAKPETRSNWALQNIYEPGSTFKVVAFSAALEKKLARVDDHIDCQMGAITVAGRVIHDHHPFGSLTIAEALAKSSNVAAIKLGLRVGDPDDVRLHQAFRFWFEDGNRAAGRDSGILRKVERWQPSSIGSIAIGQEVGVTPVQMVAAFGALANDGVRIAPHLIREVRNAGGNGCLSRTAGTATRDQCGDCDRAARHARRRDA